MFGQLLTSSNHGRPLASTIKSTPSKPKLLCGAMDLANPCAASSRSLHHVQGTISARRL
jgi:hypothetical protein